MTGVDDLLRELQAVLGTRASNYNSASAANDVYEGYVFGIVLRAAVAAGGRIDFRDVHGAVPSRLVFRTSPGMLSSTTHPYTHAVVTFSDCDPLEVHVGVRVQGRSRVLHECDVLVLPADEAALSRTKQVAPRGIRCLLGVECKYYATHLALHLARGFHGLHSDLGLLHPFFVANIGAPRIQRYLSHHKRKWEVDVLPGGNAARYLEGQFREAFKTYIAMRGTLAP
ncbi:hypothetical protein [Motilibacter deserti]|uniref:Uncharacterized protein n=1 Tax=Motilibacter deserti TaxID=2714956 RepID=A0ABX0GYB9_9ACTN|nr:hypothetical protein [Motilibacter deserti]NHC15958.1 hypothetical protein [Motilibacter deserti]